MLQQHAIAVGGILVVLVILVIKQNLTCCRLLHEGMVAATKSKQMEVKLPCDDKQTLKMWLTRFATGIATLSALGATIIAETLKVGWSNWYVVPALLIFFITVRLINQSVKAMKGEPVLFGRYLKGGNIIEFSSRRPR